jgi:hypothetical protein
MIHDTCYYCTWLFCCQISHIVPASLHSLMLLISPIISRGDHGLSAINNHVIGAWVVLPGLPLSIWCAVPEVAKHDLSSQHTDMSKVWRILFTLLYAWNLSGWHRSSSASMHSQTSTEIFLIRLQRPVRNYLRHLQFGLMTTPQTVKTPPVYFKMAT